MPGTNFSYDTGSTHVLGALAEKLSGMKLLDYLRSKVLDELGFLKRCIYSDRPKMVLVWAALECVPLQEIFFL